METDTPSWETSSHHRETPVGNFEKVIGSIILFLSTVSVVLVLFIMVIMVVPTPFDYAQATAGGIDRDSDYPETSNELGIIWGCGWDGGEVAPADVLEVRSCVLHRWSLPQQWWQGRGLVSICVYAASWERRRRVSFLRLTSSSTRYSKFVGCRLR